MSEFNAGHITLVTGMEFETAELTSFNLESGDVSLYFPPGILTSTGHS